MPVSNSQITRAARIAGVPLWLLRRVLGQESGNDQSATSPVGAHGEMQLMPGTAADLRNRYHMNPNTAWGNLVLGAHYLKEQFKTFGRWDYALAAYNAGPNAVKTYHGIPPYHETEDYVRSILHGEHPAAVGSSPASGALPGGGTSPTGPTPAPTFTKQDAELQGLGALAQGNYDPEQGLKALLKASRQMEQFATQQTGMQPPLSNAAQPGTPNVRLVGGGSKADKQALAFVRRAMGTPYVWGGSKPGGFDCSGLLFWAWGQVGFKIPRTSQQQWVGGRPVKGGLRLGDAVFFVGSDGTRAAPGHVGFYIGNGKFIEAAHTGTNVRVSRLRSRKDYVGARRFA